MKRPRPDSDDVRQSKRLKSSPEQEIDDGASKWEAKFALVDLSLIAGSFTMLIAGCTCGMRFHVRSVTSQGAAAVCRFACENRHEKTIHLSKQVWLTSRCSLTPV